MSFLDIAVNYNHNYPWFILIDNLPLSGKTLHILLQPYLQVPAKGHMHHASQRL